MKKFYRRLLIIGIAVGVFCSICVFTAGQTQWTSIRLKKKAIESNIYKIINSPEPSSVRGMGLDEARRICSLLPDEILLDLIATSFRADISISYGGEPLPAREVMGTGVNFAELAGLQIIEGRYLSPDDIDNCEKVCVLKSNIYDLISPRQAGHIEINGEPYKIVGVISGDTGDPMRNGTSDVIVPITALYSHIEKTVEQSGLINQIILDRKNHSKEKLLDFMRKNAKTIGLDISAYKLMPYHDDLWDDNFIKEFVFVFLISLLILVIASLNIIQISAASIYEREREIGLRSALGANKRHITAQIAGEILACAVKGGAAGIAAASIFNTIINIKFGQLVLSFNIVTLMAGIILAAAAGLITSLIPARKAARLDPVIALREE